MLHNANSYLILTLILYLAHIGRKASPAAIKQLASYIQKTNPAHYEVLLKTYGKQMKKFVN